MPLLYLGQESIIATRFCYGIRNNREVTQHKEKRRPNKFGYSDRLGNQH